MTEIKLDAFTLTGEEKENKISITGFEGGGAILNLESDKRVTAINRKAFLGCKSLKKAYLPSEIEKLDDWCFSKCNNLKTIKIDAPFKPGLFGRGVFEGCDNLKEIRFKDADEDLGILLAMNTNRLFNEHLLKGDDVGQQSWYEKWDIALMALLNTDDSEGSINTLVCGEEDISTDGIGSVDGEMPGETEDFVRRAARNKCYLCFLRLNHDKFLKPDKKELFEKYIKERAFGEKKDYAWLTLKEDCEGEVDYYKLYLSIVKPFKETIMAMVSDLSATQVQAKAFLINEAAAEESNTSGLDDLFL